MGIYRLINSDQVILSFKPNELLTEIHKKSPGEPGLFDQPKIACRASDIIPLGSSPM
jgi:hypothetical protein